MFERFTDRSRRVVHGARDAAKELGHNYIGTEHLLLAILNLDGGIAHDVLTGMGVSADGVRQAIQREMNSDAEALETIGIDLNAVKARLEETFGPGALDDLPPHERRGWFGRKKSTGGGTWPRFSPRSKVVLELSLREAIALKHNYIGTEHILLGLLREGKGLAAKILSDQGVDFKQLRDKAISAARKE